MDLEAALKRYKPFNEQEETDRNMLLELLGRGEAIYTRENLTAHLTASAWVTNRERSKILMAFHRIYDSWAWLGGHADGETDLLWVAQKEAMEESGLLKVRPIYEDIFSVEVLTVSGHIKRGSYVSSHLHLNVTYYLEADEEARLQEKPDENTGVQWFFTEEAIAASKEPWMRDWIYRKLVDKMKQFP